ncbi:MAG: GHKL domain-containing protein, partial [Clostridia bacterium]|nr:GHKL domain-containing protein [Clostridia bacterium]
LFKEKYKPIVTLLVYFGVLFPFSWLSVEISARVETSMVQFLEAGSIVFFIVATFLFLVFLTEGKKIIKLFVSILSVFSYSILAILFNIFVSVIDPEALTSGIAYEVPFTHFIGQIAFCFFASFLIVLLFKLIKAKINNRFQYQSKYCWFFLFPISHWITVVFLYYIARLTYATPLGTKIANISTIIYFVFSVTDFALLFFIDHFENLEIKNVQNELTKVKNELDYSQIELLKEEKQNFRKIKHDYLNFLTVAQGLIEIKQNDKALELLKDTTNELMNVSNIPLCSNETINTALFIKQNQAKQMGIDINVKITEKYPLKLSDYDVSRILFNLLDNAIEAVNETENTTKCINLNIEINENEMQIICDNVCSGKKTYRSPERGNGMKIIKDIVKKYKGKFDFNIDDNGELKKAETKIVLRLK